MKGGYDKHSCQIACPQYKYFALQNGGTCRCDNTYSTPANQYPKVADSECGTNGGYARNMVYEHSSGKKPTITFYHIYIRCNILGYSRRRL